MTYLVAVSGGIDSVVLLHMLAQADHHLIVAHVDHGIRGVESEADARFVEALAKQYRLPFVSTKLHLGATASEESARNGRYAFLFSEAKKHHAQVVTAHHQGDLVETIALNLHRGTGWRGLAVFGRTDIARPLIAYSKKQIYQYALTYRLEWVEDATNHMPRYLRNRLRASIGRVLDQETITQLLRLRADQLQLRRDIEKETTRLLETAKQSRYFIGQLDDLCATELLGTGIEAFGVPRPTRPQLSRALHAIKVAKPGTTHDVGDGVKLRISSRKYEVTVV